MQEIFLKLIQHPLLWAFLATGGVYWLLTKVTPRDLKTDLSIPIPDLDVRGWWQDHYVIVVIGAGVVMIAAAFHYYLIDIIRSVRLIVAQLVALLSETQTPAPADIATPSQTRKSGDPTAIRDLSYAIAVLLGLLVAASTVPFALIQVWINDRTIKAAEQGLITDRINTAVTGLGVEKTVKQTAPDGKITENTDANIEVPLGAVYALERISWTGKIPFEIKTIKVHPEGFLLEFTQPVNEVKAKMISSYKVTDFTYSYHHFYGSDVQNKENRDITDIYLSEDELSVLLKIDQFRKGYIYEIKALGILNKLDQPLLHNFGYYTLNEIPDGKSNFTVKNSATRIRKKISVKNVPR